MNIIKEFVKLCLMHPNWLNELGAIKKSTGKRRVFLIGTPVHGNLGDHAIAEEEKFYLKNFFPEYLFFEILMPFYHTQKNCVKKYIKSGDIIFISGGGWMGNLWLTNENVIRDIVTDYPENEIVIFPQTIYYTDDTSGEYEKNITSEILNKHANLHLFLRDKNSYELVMREFKLIKQSTVGLYPDMVLYGKCARPQNIDIKRNKVFCCLRKDREKLYDTESIVHELRKQGFEVYDKSTVLNKRIAIDDRMKELKALWEEIAESAFTVTDRLHAMLFSYINGTPCIALDNKSGKVVGVMEWIKSSNLIISVNSVSEVLERIPDILESVHRKYNESDLSSYFEEMACDIKKGLDIYEN